ncbi:hypothetical protein IX321_001604 [Bacteroides pyogenes]|nr:hypothetical protein [Bacteroides pyogenes]MBR8757443.1 hypothetical protein [Bacteroides pyogenes]
MFFTIIPLKYSAFKRNDFFCADSASRPYTLYKQAKL